MIKKFRSSKITLSVAEGKLYDETTTFNEQNIKEYLAEVEEYVKCLLTVMANEFGIKNPILVPLGLDDLPKKIEPPVLPRDVPVHTEDNEEVDDETLNDMLDRTKFDSKIMEIYGKHREESKVADDDKMKVMSESGRMREEKKDEDVDLIKGMAGGHMVDDMADMLSDEEKEDAKDEAKEENEENKEPQPEENDAPANEDEPKKEE